MLRVLLPNCRRVSFFNLLALVFLADSAILGGLAVENSGWCLAGQSSASIPMENEEWEMINGKSSFFPFLEFCREPTL